MTAFQKINEILTLLSQTIWTTLRSVLPIVLFLLVLEVFLGIKPFNVYGNIQAFLVSLGMSASDIWKYGAAAALAYFIFLKK